MPNGLGNSSGKKFTVPDQFPFIQYLIGLDMNTVLEKDTARLSWFERIVENDLTNLT